MNDEFWLQAWREGHIGFHQVQVSATLRKYWPMVGAAAGARVFVPLAGKSLDMPWLAAQGHRVLGVELSPLAIRQFFAENQLQPQEWDEQGAPHFSAGRIELVRTNVFDLDPAPLAGCDAFYDRAAIVALSLGQRGDYAERVYGNLPVGCRGFMAAFEYPQEEMDGPPFAVPEAEIRRRFEPQWRIDVLERRDLLPESPDFAARGLSALAQVVYRFQRVR